MIRTKAIDHVCLWVKSLTESKNYYEKVFGFTCTPRAGYEKTILIESDHVHFFISELESAEADNFISKQHISFEVESLDEVIEKLQALAITEIEVGEVTLFQNRNYKWCEWKDPSGIRLECVEPL